MSNKDYLIYLILSSSQEVPEEGSSGDSSRDVSEMSATTSSLYASLLPQRDAHVAQFTLI